MKKNQFHKKVEKDIIDLIDESREEGKQHYEDLKQLFAHRIGIKSDTKYDEQAIWRKALFLSTNAVLLLGYDSGNIHALRALKQCAEIYENLYKIAEVYDREYCGILAALCYDMAGYQANALCIVRSIEDYELINPEDANTEDIYLDNYILGNMSKLLNKKLPFAFEQIKKDQSNGIYGRQLFNEAMEEFYESALYGKEEDFLPKLRDTYVYFLDQGNTHISHLIFLLMYRLKVFKQRSVWHKLQEEVDTQLPRWQTYIRLLTMDPYSDNRVKSLEERISLFELWLSQKEAIESGYLSSNESFVIQMPTSAGKTLVAELAILNNLVKSPQKKCIYITPYRALTNEKELELSKRLSVLGYTVSSLNGSYEIDELQFFIMDETDVLLATPEKLDIMFRVRPEFFEQVSFIVVDEGHMIGDFTERSALLEFLLIRLKMKLPELKMLYISAVLSEKSISELSRWISGKDNNIISSPSFAGGDPWEPTRRLISKFNWEKDEGKLNYVNIPFQNSGIFRKDIIKVNQIGKKKFPHKQMGKFKKSQTAAMLAYHLSESGNCLVFCSRPDWCMFVAKSILDFLDFLEVTNQSVKDLYMINEDKRSYKVALEWYGEESTITKCLKRGIGIHHGVMFEPVKKAVEDDYRKGNLRILVSTNTIGQGINFPITNLIIHSVVINPKHEDFKAVTVRDFWNIIGRAGRAGIETEGQVIFLSNGEADDQIFDKYIKKDNLEQINSFFTLLIEELVSKRVTDTEYDQQIQIMSEPHLLHILAEELYGNGELDNLIELISKNSLFNIQASKESTDVLKKGIRRIVQNIQTETSKEQIKIFSQTGMSLESNKVMWKYIEQNLTELTVMIDKDEYLNLLKIIYYFLRENYLREMTSDKLEKFKTLSLDDSFDFVQAWIGGVGLAELKELWMRADVDEKSDSNRMEIFIQECLYFRYPWGISSFITLLLYQLNIEWKDLPPKIKSLSTFLRFGLDSENACIAMALGIKNRELARKLSSHFSVPSIKTFVLRLINSTSESLGNNGFEPEEIQDVLQIGLKLNLKSELEKMRFQDHFVFEVRGIRFDELRKTLSEKIVKSQRLTYQREFDNPYDPFAIAVCHNEEKLGYVPRNLAKFISTDLDLNNSQYQVKVIGVLRVISSQSTWNRIKVLMKKIRH
ncbi:DEAD/DEAH box helicase [Bacillus cereus]|nr:DEAD/DEAH box helicase [Bacillus cereus]